MSEIRYREIRGPSQKRTLETLDSDHKKFAEAGYNIKNAKFYNNVIEKCIFNVPIDQVNKVSFFVFFFYFSLIYIFLQ